MCLTQFYKIRFFREIEQKMKVSWLKNHQVSDLYFEGLIDKKGNQK